MTVIVQCSDAWTKPGFKHQSGHGKQIFNALHDPVDNGAVQTHLRAYPHLARCRVRYGGKRIVFNLVSLILSGLFVGFLARWLYPASVHMSLAYTIVLGIGGSLVAGLAASWRDGRPWSEGFSRAGCIASVLGAMLLIFIGRHL